MDSIVFFKLIKEVSFWEFDYLPAFVVFYLLFLIDCYLHYLKDVLHEIYKNTECSFN